mgnify:CR=1 FL=1
MFNKVQEAACDLVQLDAKFLYSLIDIQENVKKN